MQMCTAYLQQLQLYEFAQKNLANLANLATTLTAREHEGNVSCQI